MCAKFPHAARLTGYIFSRIVLRFLHRTVNVADIWSRGAYLRAPAVRMRSSLLLSRAILGCQTGRERCLSSIIRTRGLPRSRLLMSKDLATRIVKGRVAHLPYRFSIKISRGNDSEPGTLEVNVLNSSAKSVAGFPQVMQNPLSRTGDTSRREFEIPISRALKKNIERRLLVHDQFVTHVDLIVGMDEDFLSGDFPN